MWTSTREQHPPLIGALEDELQMSGHASEFSYSNKFSMSDKAIIADSLLDVSGVMDVEICL